MRRQTNTLLESSHESVKRITERAPPLVAGQLSVSINAVICELTSSQKNS